MQYNAMLSYPYPVSTQFVSNQLTQIEFLAKVLSSVPISPTLTQDIFHRQILKSSLFSARIEGNNLTLRDVESNASPGEDTRKRQIHNCMKALRHIRTFGSVLTLDSIKEIHAIVMDGLDPLRGVLRSEQSAIFDGTGSVIYLTPDRRTVDQMLSTWLFEANKEQGVREQLIDIARLHYYFEKIHPFSDGNGRTGRILLQWQLTRTGLFGEFTLPIDEFFEHARNAYYAYLERNTREVREFTSFVLEGIEWSLDHVLTDIKQTPVPDLPLPQNTSLMPLLPRRQEILAIIRDHPVCSIDGIARRFPTIPSRTISYDVQWLVSHGLVVKHGSTRGARYSIAGTLQ